MFLCGRLKAYHKLKKRSNIELFFKLKCQKRLFCSFQKYFPISVVIDKVVFDVVCSSVNFSIALPL